jgi:hypothetical protein
MSVASAIVTGTNATAAQYNNVRTDAITRTRYLVFEIKGTLAVATGQATIPIPNSMTVTKIKHKIVSGTSATITVKVNSSTIKASVSATTSYASETSGLTNTSLVEGDEVIIDITGISGSPATLRVVVYVTETI